MPDYVLWGATGQAKVLRECLGSTNWRLVAVFDNNRSVPPPFLDVQIHYGRAAFEQWAAACGAAASGMGFLVAIGGFHGRDRVELQDYLEGRGLFPITAIHPAAVVADNATIGPGSQVLMNASVCAEARMGRGCIVNTGASVDHECRLHQGVHICPGAHLAGCVTVGEYASIGTGAVVLPRLVIGEGAIVGAGAVVIHDVEPHTVWAGNPAQLLKRLN